MNAPMVFVHGWGHSARVWHGQTGHFERIAATRSLNLPGHGDASSLPAEHWLEAMHDQLPDHPAILIGWSLGGMLAIQLAAQYPERVRGLVLVATTPCFCQRPDWPYGCGDEVFAAFREGARQASAKILGRFFALMLHGDAIDGRHYRDIACTSVDRKRLPEVAGLQAGLTLLEGLDLRPLLDRICTPCLVMHGARDGVVPVEAGRFLAGHIGAAELEIFDACGHAPHLTQANKFNQRLEGWCRKCMSTRTA